MQSGVEGHPWHYRKLKSNLGCLRPCFKTSGKEGMRGKRGENGWRKGRREGQLSEVQLSTTNKAAGTLFIQMPGRPSPTRHKQKTPSACLPHSTFSSHRGLWCLLESKTGEPTDIQTLESFLKQTCAFTSTSRQFLHISRAENLQPESREGCPSQNSTARQSPAFPAYG